MQEIGIVDASGQGEEYDDEKESDGHSSQGTEGTVSESLLLGLADQHNDLKPHEEGQFKYFTDAEEEVSAEFGVEHQEEVQSLGDQQEEQLGLRVVGKGRHHETVPPELSEPVQVVESFSVGYFTIRPDLPLHKSKENLVISIGELHLQSSSQVILFISEPQEVNEWVGGGEDERDNCCCSSDSTEGALLSLVGDVGELKHAGKN